MSYEKVLDVGLVHHKHRPSSGDKEMHPDFAQAYFHAQQIETKTTWVRGMPIKFRSRDEQCKTCGYRWGEASPSCDVVAPYRVMCSHCGSKMQPREFKADTGFSLRGQASSRKRYRDGWRPGNSTETLWLHEESGLLDTYDGIHIKVKDDVRPSAEIYKEYYDKFEAAWIAGGMHNPTREA